MGDKTDRLRGGTSTMSSFESTPVSSAAHLTGTAVGRLRVQSIGFLMALMALSSGACVGSGTTTVEPVETLPDITLSDDRVLTDVRMSSARDAAGDVFVFYRTPGSLTVCERATHEVREAWKSQLRTQAQSRGARRVVVFPEDPSGRLQSFRYLAEDAQDWSEEFAPCRRAEAIPPSMTSIGREKQRRPLL